MPGSDLFQFSRCHQLLMGKCLDGFQQPVPGSGGGLLGLNQRLIHQGGEQPGCLAVPYRRAGADRLRSAQATSLRRRRKPTEHCLLRLAPAADGSSQPRLEASDAAQGRRRRGSAA